MWCKKYGHKGKNGFQSRMYMPDPHNHKEWQSRKTSGNVTSKDKQNTRDAAKHKSTNAKPAPKGKCGNLSLSRSFKNALATDVMFSDVEANCLTEKFMNHAFNDA